MHRGQLTSPGWSLERRGADAGLRLTGDWIAQETGVRHVAEIRAMLKEAAGAEHLQIDSRDLGRWDSALIAFLLGLRQEIAAARQPFRLDESDVPEAARRLLVLQLIGVPEDLFSARIEERIRQLLPFCRSIVCQVRLGCEDLLQLKGLPLHAVGVDVGEGLPVDSDLMADMEKFISAAAPLGRRTFVHGVTKKSLVVAAIGAGFDYIAGQAIPEPDGDQPGVSQFSVADLYTRTTDA